MDGDGFEELRRGLAGDVGDREATGGRSTAAQVAGLASAVVLVAVAVLGLTSLRSPRDAKPPTAAPTPVVPVDGETATTTTPVARVWPAEPVEVVGNEVRTGGHRWSVGDPGDVVAIGDWDCDGAPTPAVLRPAAGRLHVFDAWAAAGSAIAAAPGPTVPPTATSFEAAGCGLARVRTAGGAVVDVETAGGR